MTPAALIILDGFGIGKPNLGNAIYRARTPTFDYLNKSAFVAALQASGTAVGLPWGEAGNSEVGHLTIGAGQIIYQYLPRISMAIRDGSFFNNWALEGAAKYVRAQNTTLHLMGLVSSGSVHAYIDHLYGLLELAKKEGIGKVAVHVFTDGKDALPNEAIKFLPAVEERMRRIGVGRIASIIGRHWSMDRDQNWDRIEKAYRLLTAGEGIAIEDIASYIDKAYKQGLTDDRLEPALVLTADGHADIIRDKDPVIFFNFREDSARQLTRAFVDEKFEYFSRERLEHLRFVTMTEYEKDLRARAAFLPPLVSSTLGKVIADRDLSQLRVAETEKYAHITYFFDGAKEEVYPKEERVLIPSQSVAHTDDHPEMRAPEITTAIVNALEKGNFSFIAANFANADMVGHTGNIEAAIRAVEFLDSAMNRILRAITKHNYALIITADHGNAEQKLDPMTGQRLSEHTTNPVPFYAIGANVRGQGINGPLYNLDASGYLADVAPTILTLMGIDAPAEMTGRNLLE